MFIAHPPLSERPANRGPFTVLGARVNVYAVFVPKGVFRCDPFTVCLSVTIVGCHENFGTMLPANLAWSELAAICAHTFDFSVHHSSLSVLRLV
jgi:hypothetical protein